MKSESVRTNASTQEICARPAPQIMPVEIAQNRNTKSIGSLIAVLNLTIDKAPTIPREITTLD